MIVRGNQLIVRRVSEYQLLGAGMHLFELVALLLFILSSGLFFNKRFRENYVAIGLAGIIALISSYFLFEEIATRVVNRHLEKHTSNVPNEPIRPSMLTAKPLSLVEEQALKIKDTFKECGICPEMIVVPAGKFTMGSPIHEQGRYDQEGEQHEVTFAEPFAVGRFAVAFEEWDACVADNGCDAYAPDDQGWGHGRQPVISVSWSNAKAYVSWLSRKTGKPYRLLTEAQREYVARAGTTTPFWWGTTISTKQANYDGSFVYPNGETGVTRHRTVPVEAFAPNPWGLYQVHGNVWEWVEDCYNSKYWLAPFWGEAWNRGDCSRRVLRGGSWESVPADLRSASRNTARFGDSETGYGFRVARSLTP